MGVPEIQAFLIHLAVEGQVPASTQNQALSALLFLYRNVLQIELGNVRDFLKAKRPKRLSTVLSPEDLKSHSTSQTYTHVLNRGDRAFQSPLDRL
jgi:hypothetical protein